MAGLFSRCFQHCENRTCGNWIETLREMRG
jgi:hypothetical protein